MKTVHKMASAQAGRNVFDSVAAFKSGVGAGE